MFSYVLCSIAAVGSVNNSFMYVLTPFSFSFFYFLFLISTENLGYLSSVSAALFVLIPLLLRPNKQNPFRYSERTVDAVSRVHRHGAARIMQAHLFAAGSSC